MNNPLVSVIVPNYNHAQFLPRRLDSIINQTYTNIEIIILDDCSKDQSIEIINSFTKKDNRIRVVLNNKNSGSTFVQWNRGIEIARGKIIWLAESDDYSDNNLLSQLLPSLVSDPNIGLVFCHSIIIDENDNIKSDTMKGYNYHAKDIFNKNQEFAGIDFFEKYISGFNIIPNASAVLFRKSAWRKAGMSNENFKLAGDWDFWIKLSLITDIYFINKPLNFYRQHTNTVTEKNKSVLKSEALKILLSNYHILKNKKRNTKITEKYIFEWSFKNFEWEFTYSFKLKNFITYFKLSKISMYPYFVCLLLNVFKKNLRRWYFK